MKLLGLFILMTAAAIAQTIQCTGQINFLDGGTVIGTGQLDASGQVTMTTSTLSVGMHNITAVYLGDANCEPSTSPILVQTVDALTPAPVIIISVSAQVGVAFNYQIQASNSPTSFTATSLAGGLTMNALGFISGIPTTAGTVTAGISATNAGGTASALLVMVIGPPNAPPPSLPMISSFTATPSTIVAGGSTTLSWAQTGASSVLISGVGDVTGKSSIVVTPSQSISFTLTATNTGGSVTASTAVTVNPAPPVITSFTANPASITAGQSSTLSWGVSGSGVTVSLGQPVANVGSEVVAPTATTQYVLVAKNSAGSVSATVTISVTSVTPPPPPPTGPVTVTGVTSPVSRGGVATVTGTGFNAGTNNVWVVPLGGTQSQTFGIRGSASSSTSLTFSVLATSFKTAGTYTLYVDAAAGFSNTFNFVVQ